MLLLSIAILLTYTTCNLYEYIRAPFNDTSHGLLGEVLIQLTLADTSQSFTINRTGGVTSGDVEVKFGVRIDLDDDIGTGDASGYDVDIAFRHLRSVTPADVTVTLEQAANGYSTYNFSSIPVAEYIAQLNGDDLLFETGGPYMEEYFIDISPTAKSQFYSEYAIDNLPPTVDEGDTVTVITGSGTASDPAGDVPGYEFLDIISARIEF
ncbi:MAG: hypothetical protein ACP5IA_03305 [Sediminispirochaetaceae bacterium]